MRSNTPRLRLVTDASSEPLTLADAKLFCRVDTTDDDALITGLISSARRRVETETGLALMTQTWAAVFDRWPDQAANGLSGPWWDGVRQGPISMLTGTGVIEIPKRPFQGVTQIQLRDAYGALTTVDPTIYFYEVSDMRGRVIKKLGQIWPIVILAPSSAIEITFTAGFDAAPYSGVPDDLLTALKILVKFWYDRRDPIACGGGGKAGGASGMLPQHLDAILDSYRAMRLG